MNSSLYLLARVVLTPFFCLYFRLRVTGREHVPRRGPFLLAANHVSFLDPPLLGCSSPRSLRYFARSTLFKNPLFGWLIGALGTMPLERAGATSMSLKKGIRVLRQGYGLVIFPEGTRSLNGELGMARPGIGFLAAKTGAPVVPVLVAGSEKAMPRHARFLYPARITVRFGPPLTASGDYEETGRRVMEAIGKLRNDECRMMNAE